MIDSELIARRAQQQLSAVHERWPAVRGFIRDLQKFFVIKSVENLLISGSMVVLLLIFDGPYPWLWGIIGFFLSYIPTIGLILACIPPVLLAFATNGATAAIVIAVGVTVINQVGDNLILPLMANKRLSMPMSIQFISFLLWAWVLGPVGAVLALPLTMAVRLVLSMSTQTVWLGDWLSGPVPDSNEIEVAIAPDTTPAT
jgi:predicted PurR-regulated permease PerM